MDRVGRTPKILRMDMSGAHMSEEFRNWTSRYNIKIDLVPKECHHALGMMERNHAVRREQLAIYEKERPDDTLPQALTATCSQRNRLRGVRGSTPALIALGMLPTSTSGLADDPFVLPAQKTGQTQFTEDLKRSCGTSFFTSQQRSGDLSSAAGAESTDPQRLPDRRLRLLLALGE